MTTQDFIKQWIAVHDPKAKEANFRSDITLIGFVGSETQHWSTLTGTDPMTARYDYSIGDEEYSYYMDESEVLKFLNELWKGVNQT